MTRAQGRHARPARWRCILGAFLLALVAGSAVFSACEDDEGALPRSATPDEAVSGSPTPASATALASLAASSPTPSGGVFIPAGLPVDSATRLGVVRVDESGRRIDWSGGPSAGEYIEEFASADPWRASASGWNCRVHQEYEGQAAIDFYLATGTPILATMSGTATLFVTTTANAFDFYGVPREPYLGDPVRSRAPIAPFPGASGGKGVHVDIVNDEFTTSYAHLGLASTLNVVPSGAFLDGYGADLDAAVFSAMRANSEATAIARWDVARGDVIGISGDSGYSEAPHVHYTIRRGGGPLLCPSDEEGFGENGWLFR